MNLAHLLARTARTYPDAPAVFHGDTLYCSYAELAQRAARIGAHLSGALGLRAGDRVAVFMNNVPEYLEVLYAIWYAGLVAVPINAKLHAREAEFILRDSGAGALFVSPELTIGLEAVSAQLPAHAVFIPGTLEYAGLQEESPLSAPLHREPDALAWLFYTSGTTGRPKGVMQSHRNLFAMTMCYFTDVDTACREDAIVYAAPMSHGAGMYNFAHVLVGARHVVPMSGGFDPDELLALSSRHRNVSMFAAPTMVKRMVDRIASTGADVSGFKTIIYGGGPMYVEDIRQALAVMGDRFVQIYGQGESPMAITALSRAHIADKAHPRHAQRLASVGLPQSLAEVRIADENGQTLECDQVGEVMVRGDTVMLGYWNNSQASASALHDGWLLTGDMGSMDADGFLTLRDRSKDVIISGGSNIYPREIEEVLLMHPDVREVSVIGRPHSDWGEEVVAFVVASTPALTDAALDALCLAHIARFKRPKEYRFVSTLPKNNYGKVLKTELRRQLSEETTHA